MYNQLLTENLLAEIKNRLLRIIEDKRNETERSRLILQENNPLKILESGYTVVTDEARHPVTSVKQLNRSDPYTIVFKDGSAVCKINKIGSDHRDEDRQL